MRPISITNCQNFYNMALQICKIEAALEKAGIQFFLIDTPYLVKQPIKKLKQSKGSAVVKFIYSEKATEFCEISTVYLTGTTQDKSTVEISQNFVAFSEYINFQKTRHKSEGKKTIKRKQFGLIRLLYIQTGNLRTKMS